MTQITRDDPRRRHLHDYAVQDASTDPWTDLAVFDTEAEAYGYVMAHMTERTGKVTLVTTLHPDTCDCAEAPPLTHSGRARRRQR